MSGSKLDSVVRVLRFELEFVDDSKLDRLKCAKCQKIIRDAVQVPCGCKYCRECLGILIASGDKVCPGQSEDCKGAPLDIHCSDYATNHLIFKLTVTCPVISCEHQCKLVDMEDHLLECAVGPESQCAAMRPSEAFSSNRDPVRPSEAFTSNRDSVRPSEAFASNRDSVRPSEAFTSNRDSVRPSEAFTNSPGALRRLNISDEPANQIEKLTKKMKRMEDQARERNRTVHEAIRSIQESVSEIRDRIDSVTVDNELLKALVCSMKPL